MKSLEKILLGIASFSLLTAQELSPPAFLEAFPYDGGVDRIDCLAQLAVFLVHRGLGIRRKKGRRQKQGCK